MNTVGSLSSELLFFGIDPVFSKNKSLFFLVLLVFVGLVFSCLVSLLTALICLLERTKWWSGRKLKHFFEQFKEFHFNFLLFDFLDRIFLDGFSNPFTVYSRLSFVWTKFFFLANGFLFTWGILTLIFSFLKIFWSVCFLEMVFTIHSSVLVLVFV